MGFKEKHDGDKSSIFVHIKIIFQEKKSMGNNIFWAKKPITNPPPPQTQHTKIYVYAQNLLNFPVGCLE